MKVTVTGGAAKTCPYRDEADHGRVEMTFEVDGADAPELHGLRAHLDSAVEQARSHEEFTRWVVETTGAVRVVTRWRTADMDVTVEETK